ncbi:D-isomer specific 2-hydroxyacid dehydrogenase NAD-binding protein [Melioribacter roseus P3M-2]|uniref:D-isomer specific 2-hydroxyacid dehydrogenase NAD-binding protein n=1 Tax=Melioribacter roseus (strain DSM 23840 / JCM 17771 / VKM B-2668 / P3M-2) TaxID=1191523 RepID=I7A4G1_MELRP|nr:NAD(P)-dependent oxidoreductase [Melioribacter roseus]AFN74791.1 D-isomer specific 2-hydroxyacid dehydrogenase NAD-binding protein [Melioribacter roseus P3M-2]
MKKIKVAFFSIPPKEKNYIKRRLDKNKFELFFFKDELAADNPVIKDADVISVFIYDKVDRNIIDKAKKLKLIATRSTGFNHIDTEYARKKKIAVANVPYYGENTVAEHTFALILTLSRNIHKAYVRSQQSNFSLEGLRGFDLRGKTLGVIGAGSIGVHVMKIAKGFGMKVLAYDVKQNHILEELLDFKYVDLETLLKSSDIITLHCPYNKSTHHLINMNNIELVKKGALFINTARSGLIEPRALYYAIDKGIFGGAGLDVFEGEELLKEENQMLTKNVELEKVDAILKRNLLLRRENVILTPHMAFDSQEAIERILETTAENISAFFENRNYYKVI